MCRALQRMPDPRQALHYPILANQSPLTTILYHTLPLQNIKEDIQLWIDTAQEFGDPIPEPKGRRLMYA